MCHHCNTPVYRTNNCHFIMSHTHCHACCSYSFNIFLRTVLELDVNGKNREALEYGNLRHCTEVQDGDFFTNCTAISIDKKQIIRQIVGDAVQGTPQSANEANPRHPEATPPPPPPPSHHRLIKLSTRGKLSLVLSKINKRTGPIGPIALWVRARRHLLCLTELCTVTLHSLQNVLPRGAYCAPCINIILMGSGILLWMALEKA